MTRCITLAIAFTMVGLFLPLTFSQALSQTGNLEQDSIAIVALYDSLDGINWKNNVLKWKSGIPISEWYGVTVSGNRVTRLTLGSNNLTGTIPLEIKNLDGLEYLDLSVNTINGEIPDIFSEITGLKELNLNQNKIQGEIPNSIYDLENISALQLSGNELTGSITSRIGDLTNLIQFNIADNKLSGIIPDEIGFLSKLQFLMLQYNNFSGQIPTSIVNLKDLHYLELNNNSLSGQIPQDIGNMTGLWKMNLSNNGLSGLVPESILNIPDLSDIYISNNNLEDIPNLSLLPKLNYIGVFNNNFNFSDIEPLFDRDIDLIEYSPQDSLGTALFIRTPIDSTIVLETSGGGEATQYQWYRDGETLAGKTDSLLALSNITLSENGVYYCTAVSEIASGLTLCSHSISVEVYDPVVTSVNDNNTLPARFNLNQNYPNPFNPVTKISFELPKPGVVELTIFDVNGRVVKTLANTRYTRGLHELLWDGTNNHGLKVSSGQYFYSLKANGIVETKKMILLK